MNTIRSHGREFVVALPDHGKRKPDGHRKLVQDEGKSRDIVSLIDHMHVRTSRRYVCRRQEKDNVAW